MDNPYNIYFSGQNRTYNAPIGHSEGMNYAFTTGQGITGWTPMTLTPEGALRVDAGNISVSASVTGGLDINGFSSLTGQVAQLQSAVNSLTGTVSSKWQKISTNGYQQYLALTGHLLVSKIQGYSNITGANQENFIQIYDNTIQTGNPFQSIITISRQNWFIDLAEGGVEFVNGLYAATSSDPVLPAPDESSMFCSIVYKYLT